jgi:hypothetical protein
VAKIEDAHLIQIEKRGKRAIISFHEYELSADEWHRRRKAAFAQLRKVTFIPSEPLDLVEDFKENSSPTIRLQDGRTRWDCDLV